MLDPRGVIHLYTNVRYTMESNKTVYATRCGMVVRGSRAVAPFVSCFFCLVETSP